MDNPNKGATMLSARIYDGTQLIGVETAQYFAELEAKVWQNWLTNKYDHPLEPADIWFEYIEETNGPAITIQEV
jgi:hypothetical protein